MRATSVLVRWQGGWTQIAYSSYVTIEMCEGQAGASEEIFTKARADVVRFQAGQVETTVGLDLTPSDPQPGIDWNEGDTVTVNGTAEEVAAITFTMADDTDIVTAVPQLGTVLDSPTERIARTIRSIGGLAGGSSPTARPLASLTQPNTRPNQTG